MIPQKPTGTSDSAWSSALPRHELNDRHLEDQRTRTWFIDDLEALLRIIPQRLDERLAKVFRQQMHILLHVFLTHARVSRLLPDVFGDHIVGVHRRDVDLCEALFLELRIHVHPVERNSFERRHQRGFMQKSGVRRRLGTAACQQQATEQRQQCRNFYHEGGLTRLIATPLGVQAGRARRILLGMPQLQRGKDRGALDAGLESSSRLQRRRVKKRQM
jgi:hypothetical protein